MFFFNDVSIRKVPDDDNSRRCWCLIHSHLNFWRTDAYDEIDADTDADICRHAVRRGLWLMSSVASQPG